MRPGSTVIWDRSITRAPFACPWTWASGPTALMRSLSIRMPTPDCGASDRPSIRRPALMSTGGVAWEVPDACAQAGLPPARVADRAKRGRIAVSLWGGAKGAKGGRSGVFLGGGAIPLVPPPVQTFSLGPPGGGATGPARVPSQGGTSNELKDESAGGVVKSPQWGRETRAPGVVPATA